MFRENSKYQLHSLGYFYQTEAKYLCVFNWKGELIKTVGKECPWREDALKGYMEIRAEQSEMAF